MALKYTGTGVFKYGLDVQGQFPLDTRIVVQNASDLTSYKTLFESGGVPTWYPGMVVFAEDTKKLYVLASETEGFVPVGADESQLANLFNYKGNVANYESLPKSAQAVGDVYNVESDFTITKVVSNELGDVTVVKEYPAGTNVAWNGSDWDPLAGSIDLSGYATKSELQGLDSVVAGHTTSIANINTALEGIDTELEGKVNAEENKSLVANDKITLIDTNAQDISDLKSSVADLVEADIDHVTRIAALEEVVGTKDDKGALVSRVAANELAIESLNSDNTTNKSNIQTLQGTVNDHGTRLAAVEEANSTQTQNITEVTTKVNTLETNHGKAISDLNTAVAGNTTEIGKTNTAVSGLDTRVSAVETNKLDKSIYDSKVEALEKADTDNLKAAKDYADAEIAKLNSATVAAQVEANKQAIEVLNGDANVENSVKYIAAAEVAKIINDNDNTSINTLEEIAAWIADHPESVAAINKEISDVKALVGTTAVSTQITDAVNTLAVTDTAVTGEYVSAVSQENGIVKVTRAKLPAACTLTSGSANGTVAFNSVDVAVKGLKSAAYTEASAYASAAQGAKADAAAPQATTYTKDEVDAMWDWEEVE